MKKSTKIFAVVAAVAYTLALTGCGKTSVSSASESSAQDSVQSSSSESSMSSSIETAVYYTASFVNWDGTSLASYQVKKGETAVYSGEDPVREKDAQYTYVFTGWDKPLENIQANTTFTAQYSKDDNYYTVSFVNYDDSPLDSETVKYGEAAIYNGQTPTRISEDPSIEYTFSGWSADISKITSDLTVTALYETEKKEVYLEKEGDAYTVTGLTDPDNTFDLVIPSSYKGLPITKIGDNALDGSSLTSVTIPDSVTYIGKEAFAECISLTAVTMSANIEFIGTDAFEDCSFKTNVKDTMEFLGNESNPYLVLLGNSSRAITEVTVPEGTRVICSSAFVYCTSLASVSLPSTLVDIGDAAFESCSVLANITIPSSVKHIGKRIFFACSRIPYIEENGVNYLGNSDNKYFAMIGVNFNTITASATINSATQILADEAFLGNTKVTSVTLPSGLKNISSYLFSGCTGLSEVNIPSSVTEIGEEAFSGCSQLTSISVPKDIAFIGTKAFYRCIRLASITVDPANPVYVSSDGVLLNKEMTKILAYPGGRKAAYEIPSTVTSIMPGAFYYSSLTSLIVPGSIEIIDEYAFSYCYYLTEVTLKQGVEFIQMGAFEECTSLTTVIIPEYIEAIYDFAFSGCTSLKNISIPSSVGVITANVFKDCTSLAYNVQNGLDYLGNANNPYVLLMKPEDTSITTADISSQAKMIYQECFLNCTKLTSVSLPKDLFYIGDEAFSGCSSLASFAVDAENATFGATDGVLTRRNGTCLSLYPAGKGTSYKIPSTITSIYPLAFEGCTSLTTLIIPETTSEICYKAFYGCDNLSIYAEATEQPANWHYGWNEGFNGKVYFYSETEKTGCWHYVNNVPTAW